MLERIGLDSFTWLGTEIMEPEGYEPMIQASPHEFVSNAGSSGMTRFSKEEGAVSYICRVFHHYFINREAEPDELIESLLTALGIVEKDGALELTWQEKLFYCNAKERIGAQVRAAREQAYNIISNMDRFSPYAEVELRESFLMQNFVIEQFSLLPKVALSRHFFQFSRSVPRHIHPLLWVLGWVYVIGGIVYMLYFVLLWGSVNDGITLSAWGSNFALETLHACFVTSTLRLFILNVLAVELLRPRLMDIYQGTLEKAVAVFDDKEASRIVTQDSQLVQVLSPSCIAARWAPCKDLIVAKVLRSLSDSELILFQKEYEAQAQAQNDEVIDINKHGSYDLFTDFARRKNSTSGKRIGDEPEKVLGVERGLGSRNNSASSSWRRSSPRGQTFVRARSTFSFDV
jgi:hypothetical protein